MERKKHPTSSLIIGIGAIVLILVVIATLAGTIQPFPCKACHAMRASYQAWEKSSHNKVNCLACHQRPGALGFCIMTADFIRMNVANPLGNYSKPIMAHVRNESCLRCHEKIQKGIATRSAINVSHKEFLSKGYRCTNCHNTVAHGDAVPSPEFPHMDKCTPCHNKKMASTKCGLCHVGKAERIVRHSGPWGVTHGSTWERTHGMGNLTTCIICHEEGKCAKCHLMVPHPKKWPYTHGKNAVKEGAEECLRCHIESFCKNCHRIEMPHPQGFLQNHPPAVKKEGEKACYGCHVRGDCDYCHFRHVHPGTQLTPKKRAE